MPEHTNSPFDEKNSIYFRCVEDSYEPIMITDKYGRLVYVNPAWQRAYGYDWSEAIGESPALIRSHHQSDEFYREMWRQILDPKVGHWRGHLINRAKDGREVPVLLTITPYKSTGAEILGYMGIAMDLSEQRRLKDHIAQQERLATIGELTSGLAHEIGTPIGVIRGRAEMLLMETEPESPLGKTVDIIIKQSDRIAGLIATLLRLTRASGTNQNQPVALARVTNEVLALLAEKIRKINVQVENNVPDDTRALADANKLEQVLINLIINSLHAIESNEPNAKDRFVRIRSQIADSALQLIVEDSGGGIPQEIVAKIFQPFFTTKPAGKGTGLGLSIVQRLVQEMDGTIEVENIDRGARFTIQLRGANP